jgi:hypothetical protein
MSELGPVARALVDAARDGMAPDADAVARVRARVAAVMAVGAVGTAGAIASSSANASAVAATTATTATVGGATGAATAIAATGSVVGAKVVAVVLAAAIAASAGTAAIVVRARTASSAAASSAAASSAARSIAAASGAAPLATEALAASPPPAPPTPPPPPARVPPAHVAQTPRHASASIAIAPRVTAPVSITAAPPARMTLAREVELVEGASTALLAGRTDDALALLATYERETAGKGQLAEEAAATELDALCTTHDPRAAARWSAFVQRWPSSAERTRLAAICGPAPLR